jgi:hypothetical protein
MYLSGYENVPGAPGNLLAGLSFDINKSPGALGGRSGEQLKRLYEGGTQQNQQLNEELKKRGLMPGAGPQLPLASVGGMAPMGNAGFFYGPQYGQDAQQLPIGFGGISIS